MQLTYIYTVGRQCGCTKGGWTGTKRVDKIHRRPYLLICIWEKGGNNRTREREIERESARWCCLWLFCAKGGRASVPGDHWVLRSILVLWWDSDRVCGLELKRYPHHRFLPFARFPSLSADERAELKKKSSWSHCLGLFTPTIFVWFVLNFQIPWILKEVEETQLFSPSCPLSDRSLWMYILFQKTALIKIVVLTDSTGPHKRLFSWFTGRFYELPSIIISCLFSFLISAVEKNKLILRDFFYCFGTWMEIMNKTTGKSCCGRLSGHM